MSATASLLIPSIVRTQSGMLTTLRPTDALTDEQTLSQLQELVEQAVESGETRIIVDLAAVPILNSAALEILLDCQDRLIRAGGWVRLSHVGSVVRDIGAELSFQTLLTGNWRVESR